MPAWPGQLTVDELARLAATGVRSRTDYVELARALDADVCDMEYLRVRATPAARLAMARSGTVPAQILETFLRRRSFEHIVARADRLGLPLALLFKLARARRDLVLISAWLSPPKKAVFLQRFRAHTHLGAIVNYSSVQSEFAADRLGVPRDKLHHALQPVDEQFWRPLQRPTDNVVCSVGSEARDYRTLVEAVRDLDVRAELAVGTTVFRTGDVAADLAPTAHQISEPGLPPNVEVHQQLDHQQLRELYARARVVVVPLQDVDFDAGVTSIAEAMAMGKPVVVTASRGQVDLVRDGENGLYVPPGDPRALRSALVHLLDNPDVASRLGRAGRSFAEDHLTLDRWVAQVVAVTRRTPPAPAIADPGVGDSRLATSSGPA